MVDEEKFWLHIDPILTTRLGISCVTDYSTAQRRLMHPRGDDHMVALAGVQTLKAYNYQLSSLLSLPALNSFHSLFSLSRREHRSSLRFIWWCLCCGFRVYKLSKFILFRVCLILIVRVKTLKNIEKIRFFVPHSESVFVVRLVQAAVSSAVYLKKCQRLRKEVSQEMLNRVSILAFRNPCEKRV